MKRKESSVNRLSSIGYERCGTDRYRAVKRNPQNWCSLRNLDSFLRSLRCFAAIFL